jgi:hypothetical protein
MEVELRATLVARASMRANPWSRASAEDRGGLLIIDPASKDCLFVRVWTARDEHKCIGWRHCGQHIGMIQTLLARASESSRAGPVTPV